MGERKSGEANGQGVAASRSLVVAAWLGILLATLAGSGAWAQVALGLHQRPSPGRRIDSKVMRESVCWVSPAVIEGDVVWLDCGHGFVRVDSASATAKSWPYEDDDWKSEHVFRGFVPDTDGPVVLVGTQLLRLRPDGTTKRIARDDHLDRAIGLWAGKGAVEAVMPSAGSASHSLVIVRYSDIDPSQRDYGWRNTRELGLLTAVAARKTNRWQILYAPTFDGPIFAVGEDPTEPLAAFEPQSHRRTNATYAYFDQPSWVFPRELFRRVEYRLSIIRIDKAKVADWDLAGEKFGRADFQVTPDGLLPLIEVTDDQRQFRRHGRRLHLARGVDSQLLVAWEGEVAKPVASDWPNARTVVVPLNDGGLAFLNPRGRVARVNANLERTDRVFALERIHQRLRGGPEPTADDMKPDPAPPTRADWGTWFLLFTWPVAAACAWLIASLARRRRVYFLGLAGALWFVVALVMLEHSQFFVFASTL